MGNHQAKRMKQLRQWEISQDSPYELHLAADARLCQTSYTDDQSWDVLVGTHDQAALTLQTQYGFRVGLASLVPMWIHNERMIYQAQTYHNSPVITSFSPNSITAQADILPELHLQAEHIAMTSQVIAGIYTLTNNSQRDISLRFELFGHVGARGKEQKLAIVTMSQGGHALSMGTLDNLAPIVLIEGGNASSISGRSASPKVGVDIRVAAGESYAIRWVHVGVSEIRQSLAEARRWLLADWSVFQETISLSSDVIPTIQTGNLDWDLVLASAYNRAVQAILRPSGIFPKETFVAGRIPELGFSKQGDGSDHPRMWEGQAPDTAYLLLPALATIASTMAEGILRNYVALQKKDGFIDLLPNAAGEHSGLLCTPILARLAWAIYEQTENQTFLEDTFDGLTKFFDLWLSQDIDGDGIPEWQDQRQTRYAAFPTFGMGRDWAQGANINTAETPDLLAYLISEANALLQMADLLGEKSAAKSLKKHRKTLLDGLVSLWDGTTYAYRDRDTNITTTGMTLLEEGKGDIQHNLEAVLAAPNRVIVKIIGGSRHIPKITLHISGLTVDGEELTETAKMEDIYWYKGEGVYTTQTVFSQINTIWCEGLSRVYRLFVETMDTTDTDINSLLPLIADIPKKSADKLAKMALDKKAYLRPNGITMTHTQNSIFDPSNADGAGGVWMYWQTLLGEGLIAAGYGKQVADIVKDQLKLLTNILSEKHETGQFYDSDAERALGEKGHLNGIAPLALFQRLVGIRILSHEKVVLAADFHWGRSITIRQHGVYVRRTTKKIKVEFASGHIVELDAPLKDATVIIDPEPVDAPNIQAIELPEKVQSAIPDPKPPVPADLPPKRVVIEVEMED